MGSDPTKWQVEGGGHSSKFLSKTDRTKVKTVTSTELGPGTYTLPDEYTSHQPAHVPFNSRTSRFKPPPRAIGETPDLMAGRGPGQYDAPDTWKSQPNHAPFGQQSARFRNLHGEKTAETIGPGTYHLSSEFDPRTQNAVGFISKVERMAKAGEKTSNELGPGTYHLSSEFDPRTQNAVGFISKVERMAPTGYHTDMRRRSKLGPGYYGTPDPWAVPTNHAPFNSSRSDRFANPGRHRSNSALGPGSYGGHKSY